MFYAGPAVVSPVLRQLRTHPIDAAQGSDAAGSGLRSKMLFLLTKFIETNYLLLSGAPGGEVLLQR